MTAFNADRICRNSTAAIDVRPLRREEGGQNIEHVITIAQVYQGQVPLRDFYNSRCVPCLGCVLTKDGEQ